MRQATERRAVDHESLAEGEDVAGVDPGRRQQHLAERGHDVLRLFRHEPLSGVLAQRGAHDLEVRPVEGQIEAGQEGADQ